MKKIMRNFTFSLHTSLLIAVMTTSAFANTDQNVDDHNLAGKVNVIKGDLIPFSHHPDVAKGLFVIENKSSHDLLLQNVTSPDCHHVSANHSDDLQLSYQTGSDNIFRHLAVPRNSVMVFPQEGYHLICYGFKPSQTGKTSSPFTFYFRDNIKVTANFTLKTQDKNGNP